MWCTDKCKQSGELNVRKKNNLHDSEYNCAALTSFSLGYVKFQFCSQAYLTVCWSNASALELRRTKNVGS